MAVERITKSIKQASVWIRDACFPFHCVGCKREGEILCNHCRAQVLFLKEQQCPSCDQIRLFGRACKSHPSSIDGLVTLARYASPYLKSLIKLWKYQYVEAVEPILQDLIEEWASHGPVFPTEDWVVVAVPLHERRARERGFDQARRLADMLSRSIEMPVVDLLTRSRGAKRPQADLDEEQRRVQNLSTSFKVNTKIEHIPRFVILVDDVYTTGTTMQAAATVLKNAGVEVVWGFVLARGR